jgi:hypothetical protein
MWWQRKRTINVNTRVGLVNALKAAPDKIVIEGDGELVEQAEKLIAEGTEGVKGWSSEPVAKPPPSVPRSLQFRSRRWVIVAIVFALLAWGSSVLLLQSPPPVLQSPPPAPPISRPSAPLPQPPGPPISRPPAPLPRGPWLAPIPYVALGWIAVAIIAMLLVYQIIMRAMQGERNVEISWKVTEKISGRIVITKVQKTTKVSTARRPRSI